MTKDYFTDVVDIQFGNLYQLIGKDIKEEMNSGCSCKYILMLDSHFFLREIYI